VKIERGKWEGGGWDKGTRKEERVTSRRKRERTILMFMRILARLLRNSLLMKIY